MESALPLPLDSQWRKRIGSALAGNAKGVTALLLHLATKSYLFIWMRRIWRRCIRWVAVGCRHFWTLHKNTRNERQIWASWKQLSNTSASVNCCDTSLVWKVNAGISYVALSVAKWGNAVAATYLNSSMMVFWLKTWTVAGNKDEEMQKGGVRYK